MKRVALTFLGAGFLCFALAAGSGLAERVPGRAVAVIAIDSDTASELSPEAENAVIGRYCVRCHNDASKTGGLTLESFDVAEAHETAEVAEKMIRKLQSGSDAPTTRPAT